MSSTPLVYTRTISTQTICIPPFINKKGVCTQMFYATLIPLLLLSMLCITHAILLPNTPPSPLHHLPHTHTSPLSQTTYPHLSPTHTCNITHLISHSTLNPFIHLFQNNLHIISSSLTIVTHDNLHLHNPHPPPTSTTYLNIFRIPLHPPIVQSIPTPHSPITTPIIVGTVPTPSLLTHSSHPSTHSQTYTLTLCILPPIPS